MTMIDDQKCLNLQYVLFVFFCRMHSLELSSKIAMVGLFVTVGCKPWKPRYFMEYNSHY